MGRVVRQGWLALLLFWWLPGLASADAGPNRAGLVVRYSDGHVATRCVSFSEPAISGTELLKRSGLSFVANYNLGSGGAVCSIQGSGCDYPQQDCFCRCMGSECEYWAYYHWAGGAWQYSQVGAGSYQVRNGDLEGWSWGPGNFVSGTEPPQSSFAEVCSAPQASAAAERPASLTPPVGVGAAGPAAGQYAAFAGVALLLAGALGWVWWRRSRQR